MGWRPAAAVAWGMAGLTGAWGAPPPADWTLSRLVNESNIIVIGSFTEWTIGPRGHMTPEEYLYGPAKAGRSKPADLVMKLLADKFQVKDLPFLPGGPTIHYRAVDRAIWFFKFTGIDALAETCPGWSMHPLALSSDVCGWIRAWRGWTPGEVGFQWKTASRKLIVDQVRPSSAAVAGSFHPGDVVVVRGPGDRVDAGGLEQVSGDDGPGDQAERGGGTVGGARDALASAPSGSAGTWRDGLPRVGSPTRPLTVRRSSASLFSPDGE